MTPEIRPPLVFQSQNEESLWGSVYLLDLKRSIDDMGTSDSTYKQMGEFAGNLADLAVLAFRARVPGGGDEYPTL